MKQVKQISENKHYSAINIGTLDDVKSYGLVHPKSGRDVNGKLFLKEHIKSTGVEISYTTIPPKSELGYFHIHNDDEEVYMILKGAGFYQVDDDCFPIEPGSIIRVAPEGVRSLCNTSDEEMVYICIQAKENSLEKYYVEDGKRVEYDARW